MDIQDIFIVDIEKSIHNANYFFVFYVGQSSNMQSNY